MSSNYDFTGLMPVGVNIQDNVNRALEYQKSHSTLETLAWFKNVVKNNKDGHLPSIATKTLVLLDSAKNNGLNATLLAAMDSNKDGKLSGGELGGLKAWADTNENGRAETGEVTALSQRGIGEILAGDYGFYTRGSSFKDGAALSPPAAGGGTPPSNTPPGVPASDFDALRAKDETYDRGVYTYIWANLVKISKDQQYLIGTNGDDAFDAGYYIDYASDFDLGLLKNFLGGDGGDTVGGKRVGRNSDSVLRRMETESMPSCFL